MNVEQEKGSLGGSHEVRLVIRFETFWPFLADKNKGKKFSAGYVARRGEREREGRERRGERGGGREEWMCKECKDHPCQYIVLI